MTNAGDEAGVRFLQWCLPRLGMRWRGFRRVRRQVLRRIRQRARDLGLPDLDGYRSRLEEDPSEWEHLRARCRVTISRFYRDRGVFDALRHEVLPALARDAQQSGNPVRCWSAGCASGEEPFTLALLVHVELAARFPDVRWEIVGTDLDEHLLERARRGRYPASSLRELPPELREHLRPVGEEAELPDEVKARVAFHCADLVADPPPGPFQLILCRNLAFTYLDDAGQQRVLEKLVSALAPHGVVVIGRHETLPADSRFSKMAENIYRRS